MKVKRNELVMFKLPSKERFLGYYTLCKEGYKIWKKRGKNKGDIFVGYLPEIKQ